MFRRTSINSHRAALGSVSNWRQSMSQPEFRNVEELFHRALALPASERPAFLERECAGDAALRAAVEDLLHHDHDDTSTAEFLLSPVALAAEQYRLVDPTLLDSEQNRCVSGGGALPTIAGYEIFEELGRGGMGVVYRARQISLDRVVALKMLLPFESADREHHLRFKTEAEALARLQHPNIVTIYEVGESGGRPYFTMEYISGPSLAQVLDGRPHDIGVSVRLIETLARALQTIHERGIIHRDVKPGNVLLDGHSGPTIPARADTVKSPDRSANHWPIIAVPKITDFGLAKDQTSERRLTQSDATMGTPCYMAPEQASRSAGPVGPETDVYALGAILYEMLTGRPPFGTGAAAEVFAQLLNDPPISPQRLRPRLPRDLVTICLRCLEKSPHRRYKTALDLAEDLRRFQTGKPIQARPVGPFERTLRWCRRHPLVAGLLTLSVALAGTLIGTIVGYELRLRRSLESQVNVQLQQIVHLQVQVGTTEAEAGDTLAALLHFTQALQLQDGPGDNHRVRIAAALRQSPQLTHLWLLDRPVLCTQMLPDGVRVVTIAEDGTVEVRDLPPGKPVVHWVRRAAVPAMGALSSDGNYLAIGHGSAITVWNLLEPQGSEIRTDENDAVQRLSFHPDGQVLLAQLASGKMRLWSAATREPVALAPLSTSAPVFSVVSQDLRWLFTLDGDHVGRVSEIATGKQVGGPINIGHGVKAGAVSFDGKRLAVVGADHVLSVWDINSGKALGRPIPLAAEAVSMSLSRDGERLAIATSGHGVTIWQATTGAQPTEITHIESAPTHAEFSRDGQFLLTRGADGVRVWNVTTGQAVTPFLRHGGPTATAAFADNGKHVITTSQRGMVCIWELPNSAKVSAATAAELSRGGESKDSGRTVALGNGVRVRVRPATQSALRPTRSETGTVESAVFSPDGRFAIVCDDETAAHVWDLSTGEPVMPTLRHRSPLRFAAFSPDGRRLLTATADRNVHVYEVGSGEILACRLWAVHPINDVFFRNGGEEACAGSAAGVVTSWDLSPDRRGVNELIPLVEVLANAQIDLHQTRKSLEPGQLRSKWASLNPGK